MSRYPEQCDFCSRFTNEFYFCKCCMRLACITPCSIKHQFGYMRMMYLCGRCQQALKPAVTKIPNNYSKENAYYANME